MVQRESGAAAPEQQTILLVEDDPMVQEIVQFQLRWVGYTVHGTRTGEEALTQMHTTPADLVLLDLGLPGMSGLDVLHALRAQSNVPVIIVTGDADEQSRLEGFRAGADDYVVKPFSVEELTHRVRAVLRRIHPETVVDELSGPDGLMIRPRAHQVFVGETEVHLTRTEYSLLYDLLSHRGEVREADTLSLAVWGHETFQSRNYLEAQVSRLRGKLAAFGAEDVVTTVRGVGYAVR